MTANTVVNQKVFHFFKGILQILLWMEVIQIAQYLEKNHTSLSFLCIQILTFQMLI